MRALNWLKVIVATVDLWLSECGARDGLLCLIFARIPPNMEPVTVNSEYAWRQHVRSALGSKQ
ncbi:hypothetical protein AWV80_15865 [Cupriavidus sp. UYMU48A]|nr:hypothetical protein AWV80_15865 [Cupriavidus sp. UYMU48A]